MFIILKKDPNYIREQIFINDRSDFNAIVQLMILMKKIKIYDYRTKENELHSLFAEINDDGDLVLTGYDSGQSVKKFFGDYDHEYWLTVKSANVKSVLLHLIKDNFESDTDFREWLENKNIEFEFNSYT
jgi:hypothetical protein